ncbi:hypothetical protein FRC08_005377 [Ceratobasidium sp. 394]|nr:hypothetical protein FRC08_005377 [Ceratobasidium sp. 394]
MARIKQQKGKNASTNPPLEVHAPLPRWIEEAEWEDADECSLLSEQTHEKPARGRVQMRVAHNFVFTKDNKQVTLRPNITEEELSGVVMLADVASLNGPGKYVAQSGEWDVAWPTFECVPMEITGIISVELTKDEMFCGGRPVICVWTKKFVYYLLGPDSYFAKVWNLSLGQWTSNKEELALLIFQLTNMNRRPDYWRGLKSWVTAREHIRSSGSAGAARVLLGDSQAEEPRPNDLEDDLESEDEVEGGEKGGSDVPGEKPPGGNPRAGGSSAAAKRRNAGTRKDKAAAKQAPKNSREAAQSTVKNPPRSSTKGNTTGPLKSAGTLMDQPKRAHRYMTRNRSVGQSTTALAESPEPESLPPPQATTELKSRKRRLSDSAPMESPKRIVRTIPQLLNSKQPAPDGLMPSRSSPPTMLSPSVPAPAAPLHLAAKEVASPQHGFATGDGCGMSAYLGQVQFQPWGGATEPLSAIASASSPSKEARPLDQPDGIEPPSISAPSAPLEGNPPGDGIGTAQASAEADGLQSSQVSHFYGVAPPFSGRVAQEPDWNASFISTPRETTPEDAIYTSDFQAAQDVNQDLDISSLSAQLWLCDYEPEAPYNIPHLTGSDVRFVEYRV